MSEPCLYCHEELIPQISWSAFFTKDVPRYLCENCTEQLEKIHGKVCEICSRPLEGLDSQYVMGDRCYDCVRWEKDANWQGCLRKNHSLYVYNDFLKAVLSQFKFRGDYILSKAFAEKILQKLVPADYDFLVPIPLSSERLYERGFNQSEALIKEAGLEPTRLLHRIHSEKQSKKSRSERIHLTQVFQLREGVDVAGKKILLIDDIYTTGSTLRHAAKVLKEAGAEEISSLTLARG
jgi:competence protein ComFC